MLLTVALPGVTSAGKPAAPGFLPATAKPGGQSLTELATAWTLWGFGTSEDNPLLDVRCEQSDLDPRIWFLPVSLGGEWDATCDVPTGSFLIMFAAGNECSNVEAAPYFGADEAGLRDCVQARLADVDLVEVSGDGVTTTTLDAYLVTTDVVILPPDNLLSSDEALSMTEGWFLVIRPLSPGEHTFRSYAEFSTGFIAGITYTINVQ
jgi:hypothetical protein